MLPRIVSISVVSRKGVPAGYDQHRRHPSLYVLDELISLITSCAMSAVVERGQRRLPELATPETCAAITEIVA